MSYIVNILKMVVYSIILILTYYGGICNGRKESVSTGREVFSIDLAQSEASHSSLAEIVQPHESVGFELPPQDENQDYYSRIESLRLSVGHQMNFEELEQQANELIWLARANPLLALEIALQGGSKLEDEAIANILVTWAKDSPDEAWNWALENGREAASSVIEEIAKGDSKLARSLVEGFLSEFPEEGYEISSGFVTGLIYKGNYQEVVDFASTVDSNADSTFDRLGLLSYVSHALAHFDPREGLAWLDSLPPEQAELKDMVRHDLIEEWYTNKPTETIAYAFTLPLGEERNELLNFSLITWAEEDIESASRWILDNGQAPEFDNAVLDIALRIEIDANTISDSLAWANAIFDPELRKSGLTEVVSSWLIRDRSAALSYLNQNDEMIPISVRKAALQVAYLNSIQDGQEGASELLER